MLPLALLDVTLRTIGPLRGRLRPLPKRHISICPLEHVRLSTNTCAMSKSMALTATHQKIHPKMRATTATNTTKRKTLQPQHHKSNCKTLPCLPPWDILWRFSGINSWTTMPPRSICHGPPHTTECHPMSPSTAPILSQWPPMNTKPSRSFPMSTVTTSTPARFICWPLPRRTNNTVHPML